MEGDSQIPRENRLNEKIDEWVYGLYCLSEEEIAIVEKSSI